MLKASIASVLALAAAMSLTGCNGKPQEAAKTDAAPTAATPAGAAEMPANHPQARPTSEVDLTGILKAEGGKTVLDVYTEKAALANQLAQTGERQLDQRMRGPAAATRHEGAVP